VFSIVFAASVVTPSLLNNDSAILLLVPLVVATMRRLYPGRPALTQAFAFAVFLAPGVAPLVVSNPMNMIVAEYAHIGFGAYARVMLPISLIGALATYAILRLRFRRILAVSAPAPSPRAVEIPARHPAERPVAVLLGAVFVAYPLAAALGIPVWGVTLTGAGCALALALRHRVADARVLAAHVSPDILVFLWGVFLVVAGLRNVGLTRHLAALYQIPASGAGQTSLVGVASAFGSALLDNHPMSILNLMALGTRGGSKPLLAALIGGDIGPRLLPVGSLAGLLWMDLVRRADIQVPIRRFIALGALVLVPTLALSLALLALAF
jgi:arsenical pump membrane protein